MFDSMQVSVFSHTLVQDIYDTLVLMSPNARYFDLFSCKHTYLTLDKM